MGSPFSNRDAGGKCVIFDGRRWRVSIAFDRVRPLADRVAVEQERQFTRKQSTWVLSFATITFEPDDRATDDEDPDCRWIFMARASRCPTR
jgi:hypothetical protein